MIDEVAVPDRLEQTICKAEGENVLRRLFAQEVVYPEDLIFGKDLVQLGVERNCAFEIRAKRLFHDDPGPVDEACLGQQAYGRQGGIGWHAEIVHAAAVAAQLLLRRFDARFEGVRARADRHVVQRLGKGGPVRLIHFSSGELVECLTRDLAKAIAVDLVQRYADDAATGDEAGARQVKQAGQQLARRQVARGTHKDDHLRMLGTNPRRNLTHPSPSSRGDAQVESLTSLAFIKYEIPGTVFSAGRAFLGSPWAIIKLSCAASRCTRQGMTRP